MAKHFFHGKRRGTLVALSAALCASLTLGMLAACGGTTDNGENGGDDEDSTPTATDIQLLRNGNFEFYGESETKLEDKRAFISSPTSWSFTSGSPSSLTTSGIVNTEEWKSQLMGPKTSLISDETPDTTPEEEIGDNDRNKTSFKAKELTSAAAAYAEAHWDESNVYDRLIFYKYYGIDSTDDFSKYVSYSIDYEDVQFFKADFKDQYDKAEVKDESKLTPTPRPGADEKEKSILMIHNRRDSDNVVGTGQYYTSSTTITLEAGTAAEVSVWVRTDDLYHWFDTGLTSGEKELLKTKGGAYVGVINTVGGTTLSEMQIKNINTRGEWQQYTVYIRANTYASTTFRIKLGLGQGTSSDNRYENVEGYAFFDDVTVTKMKASDYEAKVKELGIGNDYSCNINSDPDDKLFNRDEQKDPQKTAYALDLLSEDFADLKFDTSTNAVSLDYALTTEVSGRTTYESFIKDNRNDGTTPRDKQSVVGLYTYQQLKEGMGNSYLKAVFEKDFAEFPFGNSEEEKNNTNVLMLLSTNGAAYTATMKNNDESTAGTFTLPANTRKLVSFFVKTWDVPTGRSGAGVTLVDGDNTTAISPFDSKTVSPVTINDDLTDIYDGWVQCFFIVSNDTDLTKTFYLKFTFGTTTVQGTDASSYADGYAAFTDFKVMELTKTQYSYASTGTYAKKVTLTSTVKNDTRFDTAEASSNIKEELAAPSSFIGGVAGSNIFDKDGKANEKPDGVEAGLLRKEYAKTYMETAQGEDAPAWAAKLNNIAGSTTDPNEWWGKIFGEQGGTGPVEANQPLVIMNTRTDHSTAPYGYFSRTMETSISANTSQRISLRVKVAQNTTAYVYLIDSSDPTGGLNKKLAPSVPKWTYWYDDDGNILRCDPDSADFNKKTDVLYYLESNGLYTSADTTDKKFYANLNNYTVEEGTKNLLTESGVVAFYYNNNGYYGYRTENTDGTYTYSQRVYQLPSTYQEKSILHYDYAALNASAYESVIKVSGTGDKWATVNFYVRTGSSAKTYRIEVWAGDRFDENSSIPAGGYVFFDAYNSASVSNYDSLRDEAQDLLLESDSNLDESDPEKLRGELALYYTFTFYDSANYLRHDSEHDGVEYSRWQNYTQSSHSEGTVYLKCFDTDGRVYGAGANPSYSIYLDYTPLEESVTPYEPDTDADTDTDDETDTAADSQTNIWLVLSSSILAIVTIVAVVAVIVRAVLSKRRKNGAPAKKAKKVKKAKNLKPVTEAPAEPAEETKAPKDDYDPYNE